MMDEDLHGKIIELRVKVKVNACCTMRDLFRHVTGLIDSPGWFETKGIQQVRRRIKK